MSFNKIIVVGNLGKDPELRYTPAGDAVCSFSLATNAKAKGETVTTWFKVTLWRKTAEAAAKYLTKGTPVYIEGRLGVEKWTDRDGKEQFTLEIQGTEMQFIGGGSDAKDAAPTLSGGNEDIEW